MAKNAPAPAVATEPTTLEPEVTKEPEADKEYVAVYGGPMHDPNTHIRFTGVPVLSPMTSWLAMQIEAGKIAEKSTEPPAE